MCGVGACEFVSMFTYLLICYFGKGRRTNTPAFSASAGVNVSLTVCVCSIQVRSGVRLLLVGLKYIESSTIARLVCWDDVG